tara:strand:+ start:126 stop:443 length:318 start_codon:yes stop_codon:yes gene_type:complete
MIETAIISFWLVSATLSFSEVPEVYSTYYKNAYYGSQLECKKQLDSSDLFKESFSEYWDSEANELNELKEYTVTDMKIHCMEWYLGKDGNLYPLNAGEYKPTISI